MIDSLSPFEPGEYGPIAERVARGAEVLDAVYPGWEWEVRTPVSPYVGVLHDLWPGRHEDPYERIAEAYGVEDREIDPVWLGFDTSSSILEDEDAYRDELEELASEWSDVVRERIERTYAMEDDEE